MGYYQKLEWSDEASLDTKLRAIYNVLNFLSEEMSIGRVPANKTELQENIVQTEERLSTPLSIAFVKMAENGDIDEVTASEHADLFIGWADGTEYVINDLRSYENKLYKCLQAHTSQADWTPDATPALWKEIGIAENGVAEWSQPISAADAYMIGDEVMFSDTHYRSLIDNNVWSPTAYPQGWEVIE